ncbi:formate dehydrogenase accessory protein FdhE, partial [Chloroflexota bacterium]
PLILEFYGKLVEVQSKAQKRTGAPKSGLSNDALQKRTRRGLPLVSFDELTFDWSLVQEVFSEVIAVFASYPQLFGEIPDRLKTPQARRLLTKKAAKAWFNGKELPATILDGVSENLIQSIIHATLQPFLSIYAKALTGSINQERWRRGYCPICGGSPDLAFLEKEVGTRWLLCSRCDTEWQHQRLMCPYCGNQEQSTLSFYTDEDELYRLYVCEQCRCYLKTVDLRKAKSEVPLQLERLYTLDIDMQAREYGYGGNKPDTKDSTTTP